MTPEQLRRKALAMGAVLEIDGQQFNAGRAQASVLRVLPKPEVVERPAPQPAPPVITRAEVQAMLDAQAAALTTQLTARWEQSLTQRFAGLAAKVAAMQQTLQQPPVRPAHNVVFEYGRDGAIKGATIAPDKVSNG
jgi:hypothetical protein